MFGRCYSGGHRHAHSHHYAQFHGAPWQQARTRRPKYNVPINIVENEDSFEVHVFATGFGKEDITLNVVEDTLFISGSKKLSPENNPTFSRQEFPIKNFERTLALNGQVDTTQITAKSEDGILFIHLPKSPAAMSHTQTIDIE